MFENFPRKLPNRERSLAKRGQFAENSKTRARGRTR